MLISSIGPVIPDTIMFDGYGNAIPLLPEAGMVICAGFEKVVTAHDPSGNCAVAVETSRLLIGSFTISHGEAVAEEALSWRGAATKLVANRMALIEIRMIERLA